MSEWQPIETAPKDGTWVLAYGLTNRASEIVITRWLVTEHQQMAVVKTEYDTEGRITAEHRALVGNELGYWHREVAGPDPTHWMPLPKPPTP